MFDIQSNNCYHYLAEQYEKKWGKKFPLDSRGENPERPLSIHRAALRAVKYFGLSDKPKEGGLVLMSFKNVVHHGGIILNGKIHSMSERGLLIGDEDYFKKHGFTLFKYLEVK